MIPLIVIDEKTDRCTALGRYLTGTGAYRVMASASSEVTFSRNLIESPAVVIAVHEADQNGLLFLKKLREREIDLPVIILAAGYDPDVFRDAVANRAEYLVMAGPADTWYPVLVQLIEKVSAIRRAKDGVVFLNKKLNLVGSATRHDVLNQLTAVSGYTELLEMVVEDPQMKSYIEKERFALDKIRRQFQFAKDYQNLATEPPCWQPLVSVIRRAGDTVTLKGVTIAETCGNASVYADPLLEKAVAQLLDNAIRHGHSVSRISISVHDGENGVVLIVEDNGIGIPAANKERIFERGFGKHTGWGLFLVREILAITGMIIAESGEPGKGARFEIHVPSESYRKECS
ncbi:MAG: hybrid sensor histidine kinase/response regulator [Methanoregula sp.]|jgi:signal transduction histidine kinase|uniref:hybrid sensor histidine kinase/response regulator n=1 Tax=Methanoregula sp. TaxID=2052170 RepID=UPI003D123AA3